MRNPLDNKILVRIIEDKQEKTATGIILPQTVEKEKPMLGKVEAIGDSDMIKVKVGDTVLFTKFSGTEVKINNEDYLVLAVSDILATVEL